MPAVPEPVGATPEWVAAWLAEELTEVFGEMLLTLAAFGSWVFGDFREGRSDLDLLAVLARDPNEEDLTALGRVHEALDQDHPEWVDRVELEYVGEQALRDVVARRSAVHRLLRISPGEPLHLVPATSHYVLDWDAAARANTAVTGQSPATVIPEIPDSVVRDVLLDHVRHWPEWVRESRGPGAQAYAVLTMCRNAVRLGSGQPVSKLAAARRLEAERPEWAQLVRWAWTWWYEGGSDDDQPPPGVAPFVEEMSASLLSDEDGTRPVTLQNQPPRSPSRRFA